MNKKAIVVYLDDNPKCVEEFSWLYKTWILWEIYSEYDLLIYHNPSVSDEIPQHNNIIKREMLPLNETDDFWRSYPFVNSFAMFINKDEKEWINKKYQYILKTDCDVFLTKHLLGKEPDKIMIGRGGYMKSENSDGLGCVGLHPDSYVSNREFNEITEDYHTGGGGWGCLIFLKKDNWIEIPSNLKIGYGDDWIAKTNKPHYSIKTKTKIETEMSTTSKSDEFKTIIKNDIKIWKNIF